MAVNQVANDPYPPQVFPDFIGEFPPRIYSGPARGKSKDDFFKKFRFDAIGRKLAEPYQWSEDKIPYVPRPDPVPTMRKARWDAMKAKPTTRLTYVDLKGRQEVDDFYLACQMHRSQYKDMTGTLHPMDYFRTTGARWQCPPDLLGTYMKYPVYWTKQKTPQVLPLSLERTLPFPPLPDRKLTGVYFLGSDMYYNR